MASFGPGAAGHTGFSAGGQASGSIFACCGSVAHPASSAANMHAAALAREIADNGLTRERMENDVGWVLLEVVLALAIAVGIVWWTFPKKPKDDGKDR